MDRSRLRRPWYRLLEHSPVLYCAWQRRHHKHRVVSSKSDLVVEGYPGAAQTFAREALQYANPTIRLASHIHSIAHLKRALRLHVPVLVLLRPPVASIASAQARFGREQLSARPQFETYERFYRATLELADEVALSPFEETTNHLDDVVRVVNAQFGTHFLPWDPDEPGSRLRVQATIAGWTDHVFGPDSELHQAYPSSERRNVIAELRAELDRPDHQEARARCEALHHELASIANARFAAVRS